MGPQTGGGERQISARGEPPTERGAWPRAPPSHSGPCSLPCAHSHPRAARCRMPPGMCCCPYTAAETLTPGDARTRAQDTQADTATWCTHITSRPPHSILPYLCEEACTGANTEAQVWTQALRGQHMGTKTHTCRDHRLFGRLGGSQVLSHTQLLKLRSTPTCAPPHAHPRALTHRETPGSGHPHVLQSV